eukprot:9481391-Pyramimonas_sp.AAC.1
MKSIWFQAGGADDVVQPGGGAGPGMQLADFRFDVDLVPMQADINRRLPDLARLQNAAPEVPSKRIFVGPEAARVEKD